MKIKMLTGLSGPTYNLAPGDECEFEDAEAIRLIEAGFAAPVASQEAPVETSARKPAAEKRVKS